jgi:hypothetical protein
MFYERAPVHPLTLPPSPPPPVSRVTYLNSASEVNFHLAVSTGQGVARRRIRERFQYSVWGYGWCEWRSDSGACTAGEKPRSGPAGCGSDKVGHLQLRSESFRANQVRCPGSSVDSYRLTKHDDHPLEFVGLISNTSFQTRPVCFDLKCQADGRFSL